MEQVTEVPERVLVVAAHPDDAEMGCAGTVAKWVAAGAKAYYLITTNGDKGTDDREITAEELAAIRDKEQRAAAAVLGVSEVVILPRHDGELEYTLDLRGDVVRWIRTWKPVAVFTHDPTVIISDFGVNHADHRRTGEVTVDAVYPFARGHLQYPEHLAEGLETHRVDQMYFWGAREQNCWVDISDTFEKKIEATRRHVSQFGDPERVGTMSRERAKKLGEENGVAYAESFRRLVLRH
ncbi:MAG TPA: PIG-L deacetylase family protein [Chloroflexota bacterium]